jgi:hypothetical protein
MAKGMAGAVQVVVAWTDMTGMRPTGRLVKFDGYNTKPEFEPCEEPKAVMWVRKATADDIGRAHRHIARELADMPRASVYTFPTTERDPLGRAKQLILAESGK